MNTEKYNQSDNENDWIPLAEAAQFTPYSAEYLSLLARKGRLVAKKVDGIWYTTRTVVNTYLSEQAKRAEVLNRDPNTYRPFISDSKTESESVASAPVVEVPKIAIAPVAKEIVEEKIIKPEAVVVPAPAYATAGGDKLIEEFMRRFNAHIDAQVDREHGFLFKIGRFIRRAYRAVFSSPKLFATFAICLVLLVILPFRFVSGFAEKFFEGAVEVVKDAQTVMGFRPGTHANEILLLGPDGEISIFGNVETDGQFRSFVEDGIAPITVNSTTKVENLNADYLDGTSAHEFTLAFVTKNGNVTYEPVFLEGEVEVGSTLLVRGATKLLNHLSVGGELEVFGDATFQKSLTVNGPAIFKDLVTAPELVVDKLRVNKESSFGGNANFERDVNIDGGIIAGSGRIKGSFRVEESFHAMQNVSLGSDGYTVRVDSENWSVDNDGNAVFADVDGEDASFDSLTVGGNLSAGTFTATNANGTSTFAGGISLSGALADASGSVGDNGYVLQSTGTSTRWVATSTLGFTGGGGSGITSLNGLNDPNQFFATTSDANIGLTITSSGDTHTLNPTWSGVLSVARGGTGSSTASGARANLGLGTIATLNTVDISDNTNLAVTATGLTLSNDTIALTAGYTIPLAASTTEWDLAYASTTALTPSYIRNLFSNTATGLTYNPTTGITSLTSGYNIPLTASTTEWTNFYDAPSTRITAGTGLSWSGNTLNSLFSTSSARAAISETIPGIDYNSSTGVFSENVNYSIPLIASTTEWDMAYASTTALTPSYIRNLFSNTATGLTYNPATGITSLTAGYNVPLTSSTTNWNNFFDTPSTRIGAGNGLSWSGNNLNSVWTTVGNDIHNNNSGNVGIGTTTPNYRLDIIQPTNTYGIRTSDLTTEVALGISSTGTGLIGTRTNQPLQLIQNANVRMTLDTTGNVGIGDTTPAALFTVGSGDAFQVNGSGTVLSGTWNGTDVDISDYTNLAVGNGVTLTDDTLTVTAAGGLAQTTGGLTTTGILEDLNDLGVVPQAGQFIVSTGVGAFQYQGTSTARTSLGLGTMATQNANSVAIIGGTAIFSAATSTNFISTNATTTNLYASGNIRTSLINGCVEVSGGVLTSTGSNCGSGSGGITSLNGQVNSSQSFATSTSGGLDLNITSAGGVHTFTLAPAAGYTVPLTASTTEWDTAYSWGDHSTAGYLLAANNLSELTSTSTARTNLGLGTMATQNANSVAITGGTAIFSAATSTNFISTNATTTNLYASGNIRTSLVDGCIEASSGLLISTGNNCGTGSGGVTSLNGLTASSQIFATSTSGGIDLFITSTSSTHTFTAAPAAGYNIPLTASTTEWADFYNTPSTRITAGDALSWAGNTLNLDINELTEEPGFTSGDFMAFYDSSAGAIRKVDYDDLPGAGGNITSLNGLTASSQTFATSTSGGLNLFITSTSSTHTFTLAPAAGYTVPLTASTTEWDMAYASTTALTPSYIRNLFSNTATGLTYDATTGITSLTSGYSIPLSASTTEWTNFYNTPSTRITAGTGLSWAGNTLNSVWTASGNNIFNNNSANVGVGTSSPATKLDVWGNLQVGTSSVPLLLANTAVGRVGIGTSTAAQTLTVVGSARVTGSLFDSDNSAGTTGMILSSTGSGTAWVATSTLASNFFQQNGNSFGTTATLGTNDANNLALETNNTTRVTIDTAGNVGIGTTTPAYRLDIIQPTNTYGIRTSDQTTDVVLGISSTGTGLIGTRTNQALQLIQNANVRMTLDTTGNVGIGDTTPASLFTVGSGDAFQVNSSGTVLSGVWNGTDVDISDYTNLAVGNGITLTNDTLTVTAAGGLAQTTGGLTTTGILEDLNDLGVVPQAGQFIVSTGVGAFAYQSTSTVAASLHAFIQNGNSFGTTATLGTNDNQALRFETNNTGWMAIDASGRVAVGTTTTVAASLYVVSSTTNQFRLAFDANNYWTDVISASGARAISNAGTDGDIDFVLTGATDGDFSINTDDFFVDTSGGGLVGIGTVSPSSALHVSRAFTNSSALAILEQQSTGDSMQRYTLTGGTSFAVGIDNSDSDKFKISYGSAANAALGSSDYFTITTDGNVGIGTTTPGAQLTVVTSSADALVLNGTGSALPMQRFQDDGVERAAMYSLNSESIFRIRAVGDLYLDGGGASNGDFTLTSGGNVGIGTTTPLSPLSVQSSSNSVYTGQFTNGGGSATVLRISGGTTSGSAASLLRVTDFTTNIPFFTVTNGNSYFQNGNVGIGTTTPAQTLSVIGDMRLTGAFRDTSNASGTSGMILTSLGTGTSWVSTSTLATSLNAFVQNGNTFGATAVLGTRDNNLLALMTNNLTRVRIDTNGNVNVGSSAGNSRLTVTASSTPGDMGNVEFRLGQNENNARDFIIRKNTSSPYGVQIIGAGHTSVDAGFIAFHTSDKVSGEKMRLTSDGILGIGVAIPGVGTKLDTYGIIRSSVAANAAAYQIYDTTNGATTFNILGGSATGGSVVRLQTLNTNGLTLETGGSERMRIDTSGNVGIGTTSPLAKLHVAGSVPYLLADDTVGTTGFAALGGSDGSSRVTFDSTGTFSIASQPYANRGTNTGETARLTVLGSNGNVGIGTSTPEAKLHVGGSDDATNIIKIGTPSANASAYLGFQVGAGTSAYRGSIGYDAGGQKMIFRTGSNIAANSAGQERMVIDANGNVGIGTTTPTMGLHVYGPDTLPDTSGSASNDGVARFGYTSGFLALDIGLSSGITSGVWLQPRLTSNYAVNANLMLNPNGGVVGIGTTTPSQLLHVAGNARIEGALYDSTNSPGTSGRILTSTVTGTSWVSTSTLSTSLQAFIQNGNSFGTTAVLGTNDNNPLQFKTNGTTAMTILANNNVGIGTSTPTTPLSVQSSSNTIYTTQIANGGGTAQGLIIRGGNTGSDASLLKVTDFNDSTPFFTVTDGNSYFQNGNVGIGDTSPSQLLDIDGTNPQILTEESVTEFFRAGVGETANTSVIGWDDGDALQLGVYASPTDNVIDPHVTILSDGRVGIGDTTPASSLSVVGDVELDVTGQFEKEISSIMSVVDYPEGGQYATTTASVNGAIEITLPVLGTADMVKMVVDVYEYAGDESFTAIISGYNYSVGPTWLNTSVQIIGSKPDRDFTVRYGNDGVNDKIWIGELSDNWTYPQIVVREVLLGYTSSLANWQGAWSVGFESSAFDTVATSETSNFGLASGTNVASGASTSFSIAGTAAMTISSAGNVGIATTSPGDKLDVSGNIRTSIGSGGTLTLFESNMTRNNRFIAGADASGAYVDSGYTTGGTGNFSIRTTSLDRLVVTGSGNVGIGTTTPLAKLVVSEGVTNVTTRITDSDLLFTRSVDGAAAAGLSYDGTSVLNIQSNGGNAYMVFTTANAERMRLTDTGSLGIGTTTPASKLHVSGDGSLQLITRTNGTRYGFFGDTGGADDGGIGLYNSSGVLQTFIRAGDDSYINGGNFGIGTTTPSTKLHVIESDNNNYAMFSNASGVARMTIGADSSGNPIIRPRNNLDLYLTDDALNLGIVVKDGGGNVGVGTSTPAVKLVVSTGVTGPELILDGGANARGSSVAFYQNNLLTGWLGTSGEMEADSSTDVGLWAKSGSGLRFYTNGSTAERMFIDTSGNVGIGTTTPLAKLVVSEGVTNVTTRITDSDLLFTRSVDGAAAAGLSYDGTSVLNIQSNGGNAYMVFTTANAERMRLTDTGSLGIGTTSPAAKLHVLSSTEQLRLAFSSTVYWSDVIASDGGRTLTGFGSDGDFDIILTGATDGDFSVNTDDLFVDTSAAMVGIGDATPSQALDIDGTNPQILTEESTTEFLRMGVGETANTSIIGWDDGDSLQLGVYGSPTDTTINPFMVITSTGNVGVGTTSPEAKLHVGGANDATNVVKIGTPSANAGAYVGFQVGAGVSAYKGSIGYDAGGQTMVFRTGSNITVNNASQERMVIDVNGNVGIGTTTPGQRLTVVGAAGAIDAFRVASSTGTTMFTIAATGNATFTGSGGTCTINGSGTCTSDSRLKTNFADLETKSALDNMMSLHVGTYDWADPTWDRDRNIGVLAQDLLVMYPELVKTAQVKFNGKYGEYYTVNYAGLTVPIIAAIKEMNWKVEDLATTTLFADLDEESFTKRFFNKVIAWLGDAENGIGSLFAREIKTDELCVGEVCVDEASFLRMVQNAGAAYALEEEPDNNGGGGGDNNGTSTDPIIDEGDDSATSTDPVLDEESEEEETPEEVVEEEPEQETPPEETPTEEPPAETTP